MIVFLGGIGIGSCGVYSFKGELGFGTSAIVYVYGYEGYSAVNCMGSFRSFGFGFSFVLGSVWVFG